MDSFKAAVHMVDCLPYIAFWVCIDMLRPCVHLMQLDCVLQPDMSNQHWIALGLCWPSTSSGQVLNRGIVQMHAVR